MAFLLVDDIGQRLAVLACISSTRPIVHRFSRTLGVSLIEPMTFRTSISQIADNKQSSRANSQKTKGFTRY